MAKLPKLSESKIFSKSFDGFIESKYQLKGWAGEDRYFAGWISPATPAVFIGVPTPSFQGDGL